ncbi:MAG: hypothetical protein [Circular genetic element sp.]|nr:MAG: hypothetical protein [Circular genetic element sp.]
MCNIFSHIDNIRCVVLKFSTCEQDSYTDEISVVVQLVSRSVASDISITMERHFQLFHILCIHCGRHNTVVSSPTPTIIVPAVNTSCVLPQ